MPAIPTIPTLHTDDGGNIQLGRLMGSGGEAAIHEVIGRPDLVAKLYHRDDPTRLADLLREKEAKIKAMLARPPEITGRHSTIAWPASTLRSRGSFVGFLMPRVKGSVLFRYHNPKERKKHSPNFDWFYLHRAAHNLSAIVEAIHRAGHVVADMNDQNFLVQDTALVSAVDTDSFQIQDASGNWHLCAVGRPEFTPPELQGSSFADHARGPEQDRFGLAVMLFQLLMEGSHPFRARLTLPHSVPEAQLYCIQHGHFPYAPGPGNPAQPPPNGLDFNILDPLLQNLFRRCFIDGHGDPARRPTAGEWREGLRQAEATLVTCSKGHRHRNGLSTCPWCMRARRIEDLRKQAAATMRPRVLPTARRPTSVYTNPYPVPGPRAPAPPPKRRRPYVPASSGSSGGNGLGGLVWILIVIIMNAARCSTTQYHSPSSPSSSSQYLPHYSPQQSIDFDALSGMHKPQSSLSLVLTHRHDKALQYAEFGTDKLVLWLDKSGQARVWNVESDRLEFILPPQNIRVARFSPSGTLILTGSSEGTAQIWSVYANGERYCQPLVHPQAVTAAAFTRTGDRVVTACADNVARVWGTDRGRLICQTIPHKGTIQAVAFSPDGEFIATACTDGVLGVWNARTGSLVSSAKHRNGINTISFHPSKPQVLTGSDDGRAAIFDYHDRVTTRMFDHNDAVTDAEFSADGKMVVTATTGGYARVWDAENGKPISLAVGQSIGTMTSASFSPDGRWLSIAGARGRGGVYESRSGKVIGQFNANTAVHSAGFSKSGKYVLSADGEFLRVWQMHVDEIFLPPDVPPRLR